METKSTRDRLIEAGIITPSTERVATWTDPRSGYVMAARPTMSPAALERTKAALVKQGLLNPAPAGASPTPAPAATGRIVIKPREDAQVLEATAEGSVR